MRESKFFFFDIVDTIETIEKHISNNYKAFQHDEVLIDFACFRLMSIGEALNSVSDCFKESYPEIPWKDIVGMRNLLTHDYYGIDSNIVFNTIMNDLPSLKISILKIIEDNGWTEEYKNSK